MPALCRCRAGLLGLPPRKAAARRGREGSQLLQAKARTLRWSLWALLAAVLTFGVAVILPLDGMEVRRT